ncbi:HNH endonuclease [Variovorax boronicumulans]|uniref:HNH endonuclease n=1 Tax=Variovorax boronicumulans TaxID=436515 RepID=UPI0012E444A0|nr:HNH endonuclease [Variovorax boronicumulans]GER15806.1 hypothetical protein VCH24_08000 [Variovorax boronicumulans]
MKKATYTLLMNHYIHAYDRVNYKIWDQTEGFVVTIKKHLRGHYLAEQSYRCAYCRMEKKEKHGMTWDIEHILPKSDFPQFVFEPENLAIACRECNQSKDNAQVLAIKANPLKKYPSYSEAFLIMHPHYDRFSDHFELAVVNGKRIFITKNLHKAKSTYIACNFFRFDSAFGEWDSIDSAMMLEVTNFLDRCPPDANPAEIKRWVKQLKFEQRVDF